MVRHSYIKITYESFIFLQDIYYLNIILVHQNFSLFNINNQIYISKLIDSKLGKSDITARKLIGRTNLIFFLYLTKKCLNLGREGLFDDLIRVSPSSIKLQNINFQLFRV